MSDDTAPPSSSPGPRPRPRAVVQPLPVQRELSDAHRAELHGCSLTDATIAAAELYTETNPRAVSLLIHRNYSPACGPALVFPTYWPGDSFPRGHRIKPTTPLTDKRASKAKPRKYDQSHRLGMLVYYGPHARASGAYRGADLCVWTEGEKKQLSLDQLGITTVGLTGVWNWVDPQSQGTEESPTRLHPLIRDYVTVRDRHHVILFDADSREKYQVMQAAEELAGVLLAAGAASVRFACPPSVETKGIDDFAAAHGPDAVRALLDAAVPIQPIDPANRRTRLRKIKSLADAPVPAGYLLPAGYELQDTGELWRQAQGPRTQPQLISSAGPVLIVRQLEDLYTREGRADVAYRHQGRWVEQCVSRQALIDSRAMVAELGPYGAPVTSSNAARTVDWLHALAAANPGHIPTVTSVSRVGWHDTGQRVFVTHEPIAETDTTCPLTLDTRGERKRLYAALRPRGDAACHVGALRQAWEADPICATMIAGALAAPLLEPLAAANFGIHLIGESSRGKTSMLKIAGSVYGDPNDAQWVASWNATGVGAELRAGMLSDLPQCYDEIGGGDSEQIDRLIYMLINGTGRVRGQRDITLRETQHWRTILLSTGERELGGDDAATGARVRIIHLPVSAFGTLSSAAIDALCVQCAANAGQVGRQWLQLLVDLDNWEEWRGEYAANLMLLRDTYERQRRERAERQRAKGDDDAHEGEGEHQRVAAYYALLMTAEQLAESIGLGSKGHTMLQAFKAIDTRHRIPGIAERGRRVIEDWVMSEPDAFPELLMSSHGALLTPTSARSQARAGFRRDGTIYVIPSKFEHACRRARLSSQAVLREWARLGWTRVEPGRVGARVSIDGARPWFVTLLPPGVVTAAGAA